MLDVNCNDVETIYNQAEVLYEKGEFQEALNLFNKIAPFWSDFSVMNYIGCCYIGTGDYGTAERVFEKLISKSSDWERPFFNLARVYLATGKDDKAHELLKKAIEINPQNEDSYFYMGVYYRKKQQWDKAIDCFLKSEAINSREIEVHLNLAACYVEIGDNERALSEAKRALEINPLDPDALFNMTRILIMMKEYGEAFRVLYDKRKSFDDDIGLLRNLLLSSLKTNHHDVCIETAKKVQEIDQNDAMVNKILKEE